MIRRTKILATLGPSTDDPEVLDAMILAGLDGARINCSHGAPHEWAQRVQAVREAAKRAGRHVAVLVDLQGPKIRLSKDTPERAVQAGDQVRFTTPEHADAALDALVVEWPELLDAVSDDSQIIVGDGTPRLQVDDVVVDPDGARVVLTTCVKGGKVGPRKGAAVTQVQNSAPAITLEDLAALDFAVSVRADFVALSFVRSAEDVHLLRWALKVRGHSSARVVAKIEKQEACENLDEIVSASDAVMVARGDLGVELGVARVPTWQKRIVRAARADGKLVITATQMLESMMQSPEPTRAEVSDVANAVIDGTSALMLSGETAAGPYPLEAVQAMSEAAVDAEGLELADAPAGGAQPSLAESVMAAAVLLGEQIDAAALVVPTSSGGSVRAAVKHRPARAVIGLCLAETVANQLALEWGVVPGLLDRCDSVDKFIPAALQAAADVAGMPADAQVVLTYGPVQARAGNTNLITVKRLGA